MTSSRQQVVNLREHHHIEYHFEYHFDQALVALEEIDQTSSTVYRRPEEPEQSDGKVLTKVTQSVRTNRAWGREDGQSSLCLPGSNNQHP